MLPFSGIIGARCPIVCAIKIHSNHQGSSPGRPARAAMCAHTHAWRAALFV